MTLEWPAPGLLVACVVGFGVGVATVGMVSTLYPPARDHLLPMALVATASILLILVLYLVAGALDIRSAGDWLIIGYMVALVLAASLAVGREMAQAVRDRVPGSVGVKTAAATAVQGRT